MTSAFNWPRLIGIVALIGFLFGLKEFLGGQTPGFRWGMVAGLSLTAVVWWFEIEWRARRGG